MFSFTLLDIFIVILPILCLLYWLQTKNFDYWKRRDVPYVKPHWFFGNVGHQIFQRKTCTDFAQNLYNKFKETGYGGLFIFRKPAIFVCSPDLIEAILTKDFAHFEDRSIACNPDEVLSDSLFNASGEKWRNMRHKLIPTFSSGKVKGMFDQVLESSICLLKDIENQLKVDNVVDVEPLTFVYSTEVIASCSFGVQLMKNNEGGKRFKKAVDIVFELTPWRLTKMFLGIMSPRLFRILGVKFIPNEVKYFFTSLTKDATNYRVQNNVKRNDFLQLLLTLRDEEDDNISEDESERLTEGGLKKTSNMYKVSKSLTDKYFNENSIASLMFQFLTAGLKPVAATITYALLELAKNPSIQERLFEEIELCVNKNGSFNYSAIKDMIYLDQVLQEIHRIYSFTKVITRKVAYPYKLPGTHLVLEKNVVVYIPVSAIHMDPDLYPAPKKFDPDRFAGNNWKPSCSFLPYGNGPRVCIAIRFASMMMKVCVAKIIAEYSLRLGMQLPIQWNNKVILSEPEGGVKISFSKRSEQQQ